MITTNALTGHTIFIGHEGENLARSVIFDVSDWISAYGDGVVSLIAQRSGDAEPYPCTVTVDGSAVTWLVTAADTAQAGYGRCELRYAVGDALAKSETWRTYTADALGTPAPEPPEPQQAWVDKVLAAGQAAVDASVNAPKIGDNGNWWTWDVVAGQYVDTGVSAYGGSSAVSSVNGQVGEVELAAEDVGAATAESVEQLAEEVGGKITAPSAASVGQTIRVKAVDDAGRPTEWEAADMAAGGEWELINEVTVTEEVGPIIFTKDSNGNDFSLKRAYINAKCYGLADATSNALLIINLSDIPNDEGYKIAAIKNGIPAASSTRPARSACYIEKVGETFFSNCSGTASTGYEQTPQADASFNCILPDKENGEYRGLESISKVCIWSNTYYSKNTFGVGTVIKLWGVRE